MFELARIKEAVAAHGRVIRVVIAETRGSTPREVGASMLVWRGGQSGTIGGGTLEFEATEAARNLLGTADAPWMRSLVQVPLGPALGQCCGGSVRLLSEVFTATEIEAIAQSGTPTGQFVRPVQSGLPPGQNLAAPIRQQLNRTAALGQSGVAFLSGGWFVEPFQNQRPPVWIFGAGHVGRAIVHVLAPVGIDITWVDISADRFPDHIPAGVSNLVAADPGLVVDYAPATARHLVMTHSHALDLEICHRLLGHSFGSAGLIGSATKWARFRKRLSALGHSSAQISRISCPIGDPALGKTPAEIAISVASEILRNELRVDRKRPLSREYAQ